MFSNQNLAVYIEGDALHLACGNRCSINYLYKTDLVRGEKDIIKSSQEDILFYIREVIEHNQLKVKNISYIVPNDLSVVRPIDLPSISKNNLKENFQWEMCRYLPEGGANYYMDFQCYKKNGGINRVLGVAVTKELIDSYAVIAETLGYKLKHIDASLNSFTRVFRETLKKKVTNIKSIGIITFSKTNSKFIIIDDLRPFIEYEEDFILRQEQETFLYNEEDLYNLFLSFKGIINFYYKGKSQRELDIIFVLGIGSGNNTLGELIKTFFKGRINFVNSIEQFGYDIKIKNNFDITTLFKIAGLFLRKD